MSRQIRYAVTFLTLSHLTLSCEPASVVADAADIPDARNIPDPVDFRTQIVPLLTRYGCNSGACHGAAAGRGDLRLSLYGSRASADFAAIARDWEGRRVNTVDPDHSLILRKATGLTDHGGGTRFFDDSAPAELLRDWIRQGAVLRSKIQLTQLTASPGELRVAADGVCETTLQIQADFAVDTGDAENRTIMQRDVTAWSVFTPEDPASVTIADNARVKLHRPGRHVIILRFLDRAIPVEILVPFPAADSDPASNNSSTFPPPDNVIDQKILDRLKAVGLRPLPPADDFTFLRRVSLDLTGRLPTPDQIEAFVNDPAGQKRLRKIDDLLASPEFTEFWTFRLGQILRLGASPDAAATAVWHDWLRNGLQERTPWDQMVREMLLRQGNPRETGPVNFYLVAEDARSQAEYFAEALLSIRLRCANCHDHPLDRWTQDDYHGLAAVFADTERGRLVRFTGRGTVNHPGTGTPAVARIPGEEFLPLEADGRAELLQWITQPDAPLLATAMVNRIWDLLMGRGLIEPVDDLRPTNPPSHPELMTELTQRFLQDHYDLRSVVRRICASQAYARTSDIPNGHPPDREFWSHAIVRPLDPAVLLDAISDVTGVPEKFGPDDSAGRAIALQNPAIESRALDALGRCRPTQNGCPQSDSTATGLPVALHLLNGPLLNQKITTQNGRVAALLERSADSLQIVTECYLRALSRPPSATERKVWTAEFEAARQRGDLAETVQDFVWSILTSEEFFHCR